VLALQEEGAMTRVRLTLTITRNGQPLRLVFARPKDGTITGAYAAWEDAVAVARIARRDFRAAVVAARGRGAKLEDIGARLGITRQAIQKIVREAKADGC
jgi:hypothetical protein